MIYILMYIKEINEIKEIYKINRPGSLMLPWSVGWLVVMGPRHLQLAFARGRWCRWWWRWCWWWWWWWGRVTSGSQLREGGGSGSDGRAASPRTRGCAREVEVVVMAGPPHLRLVVA